MREGHRSWAPRWSPCPTPTARSTTRTASTWPLVKQIKEVERGRITRVRRAPSRARSITRAAASGASPCDIALPCATQNELHDGRRQAARGRTAACAVAEGANMPTTLEATELPAGARRALLPRPRRPTPAAWPPPRLEMSQNSDAPLLDLRGSGREAQGHHEEHLTTPPTTPPRSTATTGNYVVGANIAGFQKVADAMMAQGIVARSIPFALTGRTDLPTLRTACESHEKNPP